jgi:hypothetical protein
MSYQQATNSQRQYLLVLCNKAFTKGVDIGKWSGLDYRQGVQSRNLSKSDASEWIKFLKDKLSEGTK